MKEGLFKEEYLAMVKRKEIEKIKKELDSLEVRLEAAEILAKFHRDNYVYGEEGRVY